MNPDWKRNTTDKYVIGEIIWKKLLPFYHWLEHIRNKIHLRELVSSITWESFNYKGRQAGVAIYVFIQLKIAQIYFSVCNHSNLIFLISNIDLTPYLGVYLYNLFVQDI